MAARFCQDAQYFLSAGRSNRRRATIFQGSMFALFCEGQQLGLLTVGCETMIARPPIYDGRLIGTEASIVVPFDNADLIVNVPLSEGNCSRMLLSPKPSLCSGFIPIPSSAIRNNTRQLLTLSSIAAR